MPKVLVVVSGFALASLKPIEMMKEAGLEVVEVDYGPGGLNKDEPEFCRIIKGIDGLIVSGVEKVPRRVIEGADRLKLIVFRGVGYDGMDLAAATDHGIMVVNNPGSNRKAVADMAMGLILSVSRKIGWMDRGMREGKYSDLRVITYDVSEKTIGIIGLGRIGKSVALRAKGFEMDLLYHDIVEYPDFANEQGIKKVSLEALLKNADIVTLHVPLDGSTRKMIGEEQLKMMKSDAILINTARGGLIDEQALYTVLKSGHLYGYGADAHEKEPPVFHDLLQLDNVVTTPHMAGVSQQALINMSVACAEKMIQFFVEEKIPGDVINSEVLEKKMI